MSHRLIQAHIIIWNDVTLIKNEKGDVNKISKLIDIMKHGDIQTTFLLFLNILDAVSDENHVRKPLGEDYSEC